MNIFISLILGIVTTLTGYGFYTDTTPREMVDALGSTMTGSAWFLNASQQIQAGAATWGLKIPSLSSSGDCLVTDASGVVTTSTCGAGGGGGTLSTSTAPNIGDLAFWTGVNTLGTVATGTLTETATGLELSTTRGLVGGSSVLSLTSGFGIPLTASTTNWNTFYDTPSTRITAGTGVDWTGTTLNTVLTAGDGLTLTGEDFDFDGGATPSGDLGGTWASPSVTDDSHAHTGTTLSGIDISGDTNLTADGTEIILTGDALSLGTALTFTTGTSSTSFQTALLGVGTDYVSDITGTGIVMSGNALTTSLGTSITASEMADGDHGFFTYTTNVASVDASAWSSANMASYLSDETGTAGSVVFSVSPTFTGVVTANVVSATGLRASASSTLGFASSTSMTVSSNAWLTYGSSTGFTATDLFATRATSTTSFFSALGTFTDAIINGILRLIGVANPTVNEAGEIAYNTATQSFSVATSTTGLEIPFAPPFSFAYASSSWTGTTTEISRTTGATFDELITTGICYANGTGKIVVGNGTASSTLVNLSAGTTTVAVNQRFNKNGTRMIFAMGTPTTLTTVNCTFDRYYLR